MKNSVSTNAVKEISYDELLSHNAVLTSEVLDLKRTVILLSHQLVTLQRGMFGKSSEKLSAGEIPLALFPEIEVESLSQKTVIQEHARSKRNGRSPLPETLPRERIEYTPLHLNCPCCGNELAKIGEDITEELEVVSAKLFVKEHARGRYACSKCKDGVITAELPRGVQIIDRVRAGTGLLADIIVKKFCDHLPLHRQEKIFERSGITLSRSTMCDWLGYCADALNPIVQQMKKDVLTSFVINADETTLDIQTDEGMKTGRLWGYLGDKKEVVFQATMTRGGEHASEFLQNFSSYLQVDAYAGYNDFIEKTSAIRVGCWAHVRRKFFDAKSLDPPRCKEILSFIGELFSIERYAKEKELSPEEHTQIRNERARPILEKLGRLLKLTKQETLPKSPLNLAANYALNQWQELNRYLDDPRLRLDNNPIEQQIRPIAVGRNNWLFAGSKNGADRAAIFFSLINSCKLQNINPWQYLNDVMKKLETHPQSKIAELTPRGWKNQTKICQ